MVDPYAELNEVDIKAMLKGSSVPDTRDYKLRPEDIPKKYTRGCLTTNRWICLLSSVVIGIVVCTVTLLVLHLTAGNMIPGKMKLLCYMLVCAALVGVGHDKVWELADTYTRPFFPPTKSKKKRGSF